MVDPHVNVGKCQQRDGAQKAVSWEGTYEWRPTQNMIAQHCPNALLMKRKHRKETPWNWKARIHTKSSLHLPVARQPTHREKYIILINHKVGKDQTCNTYIPGTTTWWRAPPCTWCQNPTVQSNPILHKKSKHQRPSSQNMFSKKKPLITYTIPKSSMKENIHHITFWSQLTTWSNQIQSRKPSTRGGSSVRHHNRNV